MKNKNIYYFILGGISLALSFPPFPFFPLAFIAFILILHGIEENINQNNNKFFLKFYFTFFLYHTISNWWISSFQENTDPYLMISGFVLDLFHPLFFLIPMYIYLKVRNSIKREFAVLLFPVIWVGWEYFHSLGELSYPWLAIGNTQINNIYFVQIADIFGVWGISLSILIVNVLLFLGFEKLLKSNKKFNRYLFILTFLMITIYSYGLYSFNKYDNDSYNSNNKLIISVIQPNINPWDKWASGPIEQIVQNMKIQDSLNLIKKADLTIWPETSILRINNRINKDKNIPFLENWSNTNDISILSGYVFDYEYKQNQERQMSARFDIIDSVWEESYNSAIMINPSIEEKEVYFKGKLTPFAERIPNLEYFYFLSEILKWNVGESSWGLGERKLNLKVNNINEEEVFIAPIICIESIYPNFVREFTYDGAEIISIITNDAWYDGTPGPIQHFNIARMRAIENRRYIARSANSGISGFIAPNGETVSQSENMVKTGLTYDIPILKNKSIYVEYGDVLAKVLMYLTLIIFIYCTIYRKVFK